MTKDADMTILESLSHSTEKEHENYINAMKENINFKPDPEVGIFWYDIEKQNIFGVAKDPINSVNFTPNGVKTGKILHRDYWLKLRKMEMIRGKTDGIFFQKYIKVPRGRIFQLRDGTFQINVGKWIKDIDAKIFLELIKTEFNLDGEKIKLQIDEHWDIGRGDSDF